MAVNRSFLERKTDEELLGYVRADSRFVSDAVSHAYAILLDRGHAFSRDESTRIEEMIAVKAQTEDFYLHPYHQKIGRLLYLSGALGLGFLLGFASSIDHTLYTVLSLLYFIAILAIGYLVSHGYTEMRIALLLVGLAGLTGLAIDYQQVLHYPVFAIVAALQLLILFWAIAILFKIPKKRAEIADERSTV